jgi:ABC-type cobalamin transport system ATPase subunit
LNKAGEALTTVGPNSGGRATVVAVIEEAELEAEEEAQ